MLRQTALLLATLVFASTASAQDISTHVLDLARGVGGVGVPVTLDVQTDEGWSAVGQATTADHGRVESFTSADAASGVSGAATYRLTFDVSDYWSSFRTDASSDDASPAQPFFPEIVVVFRVEDPSVHTHVPVVVSPYGYSTYRGN